MHLSLKFLISLISIIIMANTSQAQMSSANLIPRAVLFGNPDKTSVLISPNGKYISYIAPLEGVLNVYIAPIDKPTDAKAITQDKGRGIRGYFWAYDNEHIIYMQDEKGDENFRLYSYSLRSGSAKLLTPESGVKAHVYEMSFKHPNMILIGLNERDKRFFDIYKVNLVVNSKELLIENDKFVGFTVDDDLQIRFGTLTNKDGAEEYYRFEDNKWSEFMKVDIEDTMTTGFVGFDKTGKTLYMIDSRDRNTGALKSLNPESKELRLIIEDPRADISLFTRHPTEKNIQAVAINYEKMEIKVLDNSIKADIDYLKDLERGELHINARSIDDKTWLAAYISDVSSVKYYVYDSSTKKAKYLFSNRKDLEEYSLLPMNPIVIKSRDGLNLVSYLTLPSGYDLGKNHPAAALPLVLYVHGGPWARDSWGLNPVHQWLGSRGYAVLSVNYRGSTGFGKNFINAGNLQWARKMHDDLIDAVNWAIKNKIANLSKIAIMGGSYGGYATLVGLTMTPEVFACGVDLVGPSNLLTFAKSIPPYWEPILNDFKKRVGGWETSEELKMMAERSPITYVDKIVRPLFIAHGAHDPRVKQAESDQIVHAMETKNIPVIYALYDDEGHGFARPENRLSYYALVEQFLAKILGGRNQEIGDDLKGSSLILNNKKSSSFEAQKLIDQITSK